MSSPTVRNFLNFRKYLPLRCWVATTSSAAVGACSISMPNISNVVGRPSANPPMPSAPGCLRLFRSAMQCSHLGSRRAAAVPSSQARIAVFGRRHRHQVGEQPHALGEGQGLEAGKPGFKLLDEFVAPPSRILDRLDGADAQTTKTRLADLRGRMKHD